MILKRNNHRQTLKFILGALLSCLLFATVFNHSTSAYTKITKSQIQLISDFTLDNKANAGGTITKGYYVFPDTKGLHGGPGTIKVVDRNTCQVTSTVKIGSMYLSGLYNKWNTNYITLIGMGSQKGCYQLKGSKLQKASGCPNPPGRSLIYQGTGQGNVATFNGYSFKVAGFSGGIIGVWNSSGRRVATYQIPSKVVSAEPENIAIDGATGEVYINYAKKKNGKRHSLWYKIDSSVFSKYTGKKGTSNPTKCKNNTATSGSSENRESNKSAAKKKDSNSNKNTYTPSVSTYDGVVDTIFFGTMKDDGEGCGVYTVLDLVMTILTIGIGIAALIGISISGITYLTAGNSVEKTTKAKRRIYEIVIGLAAYVAIFAVLTFLLPEFNPELKACKTLTAEEIAARDAASEPTRNSINTKESTSTKPSTQESIKNMTKEEANWAAAKAISEMGVKLASKGSGKNPTKAFKQAFASSGVKKSERNHDSCHQVGKSCGSFVSTVVAAAGVDAKIMKKKNFADTILSYMKGGGDPWITIKTPSGWKKGYKARRGDVAIKQYCDKSGCHWHTFVYVYYKGKLRTAEASHCKYYGRISSNSNPTYVFRYNGGSKYFKG